MNTVQLILLVLALVLALVATAGVSHPRLNLVAASLASYFAAVIVAMAP